MNSLSIIYEDNDFLAINKPAGLLVHPTGDKNERRTLVDWLLKKYPEIRNVGDDPARRPGVVHRLDKDTSGVLLVAKNPRAFAYLKSLFHDRKIKKTYLAWVHGVPRKKIGTIDAPIALTSGSTRRTVHKGKMEKSAITEYRIRESRIVDREPLTLLEVYPRTGRTHQIRVHLTSIGHPVVGDIVYGRKDARRALRAARHTRMLLHALALEFTDMHGKRLRLEAAPPRDFVV